MQYGNLRWVDIDALDKDQVTVVCPLASLEQHGHHLPLLTDTYLVTGVAQAVEKNLPEQVLLLPALWLGASDHHLDFPGTVSVPNSLYTEMIKNVTRSFVKAGFRRILFLNGHGGNVVPGTQAITEMSCQDDASDAAFLALSSYWTVAQPVMSAEQHGMATPQLSHACEYETSMMLHLHKDLVVMSQAKGIEPVLESRFYSSERLGRVNVAGRFHRRTATGAMGKPEEATAEKGASLLAAIAEEVTDFVRDFLTWQRSDVLGPLKP